jgi:hypothetical protein
VNVILGKCMGGGVEIVDFFPYIMKSQWYIYIPFWGGTFNL